MNAESLNPYLEQLRKKDVLYHLGLDTKMDLKKTFQDTKYVCMGGSAERAKHFARKAAEKLGITFNADGLRHIGKTERFELYKVGPVISVSHGMGMGSLGILLNEITKLLYYAECDSPLYIRIGTSGGIGVDPGTVVITDKALNEDLQSIYTARTLVGNYDYPTDLDQELIKQLSAIRTQCHLIVGHTAGLYGFYEEQLREDGALPPPYTEEQILHALESAQRQNVKNIEMEAPEFAAFCLRAKIRAAIVNAIIIDRLRGDQIDSDDPKLPQYSDNAQQIVLEFIKNTEEKEASH